MREEERWGGRRAERENDFDGALARGNCMESSPTKAGGAAGSHVGLRVFVAVRRKVVRWGDGGGLCIWWWVHTVESCRQ